MSRYQNQSGGKGGGATGSRRDDRSGLIDIRALSAVIDAQRSGSSASASSVALPTFASPWTLQDVDPPRRPGPSPVVSPARVHPTPSSDRLLYVMIAGLSAAVLSLGVYAAVTKRKQVVVVETSRTVATQAAPQEPGEPEASPGVAVPEDEVEPSDVVEPEQQAPSAGEQDAPAAPKAAPGRTRPRDRGGRGRGPKPRPHNEPVKPNPPKKDDRDISVECLLDQSKCGARSKPDRGRDKTDKDTGPLPEALSSSQIRTAIKSVKPEAKACGRSHGASSGEQVRVKLSIIGRTGAVTKSDALGDHAGTALGRCVAKALSGAQFPQFRKKQSGVVYVVRM